MRPWFALLWFAASAASTLAAPLPTLQVGPDHRHLVTQDGKPFFLLGDTAWELFHRLTREETELYLTNRVAKGFNTILAVALAEFEFDQPNAYGEMPLVGNDPAQPRSAYFDHVDWVVDQAASLGLYVAILPTWGDKWNKKWGKGPEVFTPQNAAIYGEWLGARYREKSSVLWILGGDRPVETETHRAILRAMAEGLQKGDGGRHLISYHPQGGRNSSDFWPDEPWLDFHMFQSGHSKRAAANYDMNAKNLALPALKPTLDGEPNYEDHPVRSLMQNGKPTEWFDDDDARRAAWWSILSGACGHVYGTHSIWQFHDPEKRKPLTDARTPWKEALDLPGAAQMGVLRAFFERLDWTKLRRDDDFLRKPGQPYAPAQKPLAALAKDGSFAVVYLPAGVPSVQADLSQLNFEEGDLQATAYDAATGETMELQGGRRGVPFSTSTEEDWVLLLREKD